MVKEHIRHKTEPKNIGKSHSFQSLNERFEEAVSKSKTFFAEKQVSRSFSEKETKVSNPLQKMGSFFGKAIVAFRNAEERISQEFEKYAELCETFSVSCKGQTKTMTNVMLRMHDMDRMLSFSGDKAQDMAIKAQTMTSLYSQSLNGVIIMARLKDMNDYGSNQCNII